MKNNYVSEPWAAVALLWLLLCAALSGRAQAYYTLNDGLATTTLDQLRRVNPDGTNDVLIKDNFVQSAGPAVVDLTNNRVLVADSRVSQASTSLTNTKIVAVSLAAGNAATTLITPAFITGSTSTVISGLALDKVNNYLYYMLNDGLATTTLDQLRRVNLDGTNDVLIKDNFVQSAGMLELDVANNRVLVADVRVSQASTSLTNTKIVAVSLAAGNAVTTLVTPAFITGATSTVVADLVLDKANSVLYYTLNDGGATTMLDQLRRINLNGTNDVLVKDNFVQSAGMLELDVANNRVLVADVRVSQASISLTNTKIVAVSLAAGNAAATLITSAYTTGSTSTVINDLALPEAAFVVTKASQTNISCFGGANGAASINVPTGGIPPYTYNWTPGNPTGDGTRTVTGLTAGTWTVTVTDANGSMTSQTFTVTQPPALATTGSQTNVTTVGGSNGTATVSASGGTPGYTYDWAPGTPTGDGTASVSGLSAGTYTVTVTDANSCTTTRSYTITQPTEVVSSLRAGPSPTNAGSVSFTVTFSGSITGLSTSSFSLLTSGGISGAGLSSVSGSGTTYTVVVNTGTGSGVVQLQLSNSTGLSPAVTNIPFAGEGYTIDRTPPTVSIASTTAASGGTSGTSPFAYTVTFSESVTGFVAGDLTVGNGTVSGFSGSGTTYTFNVTPTANGAVTVNVAANVAQDGVGNGNTAATQYSITYAAPVTPLTWNGSISTDWFTAANWTPAQVPNSTLDVTIPAAAPNMPLVSTGTARANNLTLASGATLSQSGGTLGVDGNLTNNGTFVATGGAVVMGATVTGGAPGSVLGTSNTRFWDLNISTNGAQLGTPASTSVQRLLTLNANLVTNGNPLTLESNATGTALVVNNGSNVISGNVTVQRYIDPGLNAGLGYRQFSAPISTATVASLATASFTPVVNGAYNTSATPTVVTPFPTVYGYDQARLATATNNLGAFDKGWTSPGALTDPLILGRGYTANLTAGQTVALVGTLNTGSVAVTGGLPRGAGADAGWHLLGNPYPAPLDWKVARTGLPPGVLDAIYVFKSATPYTGSYQFYQNGFGTLPGGLVPSMQGFFLRVSQNVPTFSFLNAWRVTSYQNPIFNRGAADTRSAVQLDLVTAAGTHEPTFVYFENGATAGFDAHFDAEKLPNSTGLNLSSEIARGQRLAINGLPVLSTASLTVPLTVGVPAAGAYTLNAAQLRNLGTTPVYLRDQLSGAVVDLVRQPSYRFVVNNASALITGRFELVFSPQATLATAPAALAAQVGVYPNPASTTASVELPAALGRVAVASELVDALGRTVRTQLLPAQGAAAHRLDLANLAMGVYTLHLNTSAGVVVKKLLVQ